MDLPAPRRDARTGTVVGGGGERVFFHFLFSCFLHTLSFRRVGAKGSCDARHVSFLILRSKLDGHHGFVDSEESRHEGSVQQASNFWLVPLSQAVGSHLDGRSPAFTVDGSSVSICAWSSAW